MQAIATTKTKGNNKNGHWTRYKMLILCENMKKKCMKNKKLKCFIVCVMSSLKQKFVKIASSEWYKPLQWGMAGMIAITDLLRTIILKDKDIVRSY